MNARYYVPNTNRFLTPDTIVPDPTNPQQYNRYSYTLNNPINLTDPSGHCAEFGDDTCWTMYDRIIQLCPECHQNATTPGTTLDQYGYNYQEEIFNRINNGWRPKPMPSQAPLDRDSLAKVVGYVDLGSDTYNQAAKLLRKSADDVVPGPIGLGLILIQTGLDHGDEGFVEFGYYLITRAAADAGVDVAAAGAAGFVFGEIGGPPGVVVGVGTFVAIEVAGGGIADWFIDTGWQALNTDQAPQPPVIIPYDPANPRVRTPPASTPNNSEPVGTPLPPR